MEKARSLFFVCVFKCAAPPRPPQASRGKSNRPVLTATRSDKTQNTVELMRRNPKVTGTMLLVFLHNNERQKKTTLKTKAIANEFK